MTDTEKARQNFYDVVVPACVLFEERVTPESGPIGEALGKHFTCGFMTGILYVMSCLENDRYPTDKIGMINMFISAQEKLYETEEDS